MLRFADMAQGVGGLAGVSRTSKVFGWALVWDWVLAGYVALSRYGHKTLGYVRSDVASGFPDQMSIESAMVDVREREVVLL